MKVARIRQLLEQRRDQIEDFRVEIKTLVDNGGYSYSNPGRVISWRGAYEQPSLVPAEDEEVKVPEFIDLLRKVHGQPVTGYKGGNYILDEDSHLWSEDYGDCYYWAIVSAEVDWARRSVVLLRVQVPGYW